MAHSNNKNQLTETNPKVEERKELVEKDIKTIILTIVHIFKNIEERFCVVSRDMEDISDPV